MGLSSNARLLYITARLTSNEYESQQISNAKMRLATQSQEASNDYISALNTTQLMFTTYDAKGNSSTDKLTAGVLYQYSDMKNQYVLSNNSGQALISQTDAYNFEQSANLEEFLEANGVIKQWKSPALQTNYETLDSPAYRKYKKDWQDAINNAKNATYNLSYSYTDENGNPQTDTYNNQSSDKAWEIDKSYASKEYQKALAEYKDMQLQLQSGVEIPDADVDAMLNRVNNAKAKYSDCITYDNWLMSKAAKANPAAYEGINEYYKVLEEFNAELEDYGTTLEDGFSYNDATKAQWYTNLWYRLNGQSSEKSLAGSKGNTYSVIDEKLLHNTTWLQDSITQGIISIEKASNEEDVTNTIPNEYDPTIVNLEGISWNSVIYSSCSDITQKDDEQAIARAEAEYKRKTEEINAKDEKYQNKIKTLETEHTALQTEYESVQSALNKNIERSFKAFS